MKIAKTIVAEMAFPYAISVYGPDNEKRVICATQDKGGSICFDAVDGRVIESVWDEPGGTMTIWPVPGKDEFLATHQFHRGFQAEESHIVHVKRGHTGKYGYETCYTMPYLHRFTVTDIGDEKWLVAATLCKTKAFKDDWSTSGSIHVGKLQENLDNEITTTLLLDGITKNHGMYRGPHDDIPQVVVVTGVEGAFEIVLPLEPGGEWRTEQLLDNEISDIRIYDIDGDGVDELITIEEFHGSSMNIYKKTAEGYAKVTTVTLLPLVTLSGAVRFSGNPP